MDSRRQEDLDVTRVRHAVQLLFTHLTFEPDDRLTVHRGASYAVRWLGYSARALARLPSDVTSTFMGVGNPHVIGSLAAGETVVDLGCGSGTDLLLAAQTVGSTGRAIGIDMTDELRQRARRGADHLSLAHVAVQAGDLADLPLAPAIADVVLSNGVLSLVANKTAAIAEMARVLRPGGRLHLADVVIDETCDAPDVQDLDLWTCGIAGALCASELLAACASAGFGDLRIAARFDAFRGSAREAAARTHGAIGVNLFGVRR
jgi:SAM-dependent methyltransferase